MTAAEKNNLYRKKVAELERKKKVFIDAEINAREVTKKRAKLLAESAEEMLRVLIMLQEDSGGLIARRARDELIAKLS